MMDNNFIYMIINMLLDGSIYFKHLTFNTENL